MNVEVRGHRRSVKRGKGVMWRAIARRVSTVEKGVVIRVTECNARNFNLEKRLHLRLVSVKSV